MTYQVGGQGLDTVGRVHGGRSGPLCAYNGKIARECCFPVPKCREGLRTGLLMCASLDVLREPPHWFRGAGFFSSCKPAEVPYMHVL